MALENLLQLDIGTEGLYQGNSWAVLLGRTLYLFLHDAKLLITLEDSGCCTAMLCSGVNGSQVSVLECVGSGTVIYDGESTAVFQCWRFLDDLLLYRMVII